MTVDRVALIEAAAKECRQDRAIAGAVLDAVLPLIADAIEAEIVSHGGMYPYSDQRFRDGLSHARWLVRWLGGNDGSSDA